MSNHGNLYWEIQFAIGATEDDGYCERTHISVCGYDYRDTFERAQKLYNLAHGEGRVVSHFSMALRYDDSNASARHFDIFKTWFGDPNAFFSATSETSMRTLYCTK